MFASKTPWIVLLVLWMIGSTWWHVCHIKQRCADDASPAADAGEPGSPPALTIADGDRFRLVLPGTFRFAKSGANVRLDGLGEKLQALTAYLKAHPRRKLMITGYYGSAEANSTQFNSLGLGRAESLRQYLVQQGVRSASLTTNGEQQTDLPFSAKGDSLYGGLGFTFTGSGASEAASAGAELPGTETELAAAEKYRSVFEPINLYFSLNEANYIKTPETKRFFDEAARYLAAHADKKLIITGYTDNVGSEAVNRQLARDRARSVRNVLRLWRIESEQLVVDAKGEDDPRASNDTREGRKANRRVTVVVQP